MSRPEPPSEMGNKLQQEAEGHYRSVVEDLTEVVSRFLPDGTFLFMNDVYCRFFGKDRKELLGSKWHPRAVAEDLSIIEEKLRALSQSNPVIVIENRVYSGSGEVRWMQFVNRGFFSPDGKLREIQSVGRDITERKKAEDALRVSKELTAADLEAMKRLQTVGALYLGNGNLQQTFDALVEAAMAITGTNMGNLQLLDPASGDLRVRAHRGFDPAWVDFWNHAYTGKGACHTALERGERVIVEDVTTDAIFVGTPALDVQLKAGVRAVQSTPLMGRSGKALGMFSTHFRTPHRPDERTLRLLDLLARQTADMIERSQAEERQRQMHDDMRLIAKRLAEADEETRHMIATELHDRIGQNLTGLNINLNYISRLLSDESMEQIEGRLADSMKLLENTIEQLRNMTAELRPPLLDDQGLLPALQWHCSQFSDRTGIEVNIYEDVRLPQHPGAVEVAVFRIIQEVLINVSKHSGANMVEISLGKSNGSLVVTVRDNGIGFDPGAVRQRQSLGFVIMQERAKAIDGKVSFETSPGKGTTVMIEVPV